MKEWLTLDMGQRVAFIDNYIVGYNSTDSSPFFALAKAKIPELVVKYCAFVETDSTVQKCTCAWIVHPDDVDKPEGKRRIRQSNALPNKDCWVHTKEGFILGFFTWVFQHGATSGNMVETPPEHNHSIPFLKDEDEPSDKISLIFCPADCPRRLWAKKHIQPVESTSELERDQDKIGGWMSGVINEPGIEIVDNVD